MLLTVGYARSAIPLTLMSAVVDSRDNVPCVVQLCLIVALARANYFYFASL